MKNILVVFTCFNRKENTEKCITSITERNPQCNFSFIIADDGSTDGTEQMLSELSNQYSIEVLHGNGDWYYAGGMHAAMQYAIDQKLREFNYLLMINDDVEFLDNTINEMVHQSKEQNQSVVVGVMKSCNNDMTYSAIKYVHGYKYINYACDKWNEQADSFMANCVLIPYEYFLKTGAMDSAYRHSLGDFDYGLSLKNNGYEIYASKEYVGICERNSKINTWLDRSLSRIERIKMKESIKGAPTKQWFYFLKKNFGIILALKGVVTPYIRILIGK